MSTTADYSVRAEPSTVLQLAPPVLPDLTKYSTEAVMKMIPGSPNHLFVGNLLGVFETTDGGATWSRTPTGMPYVIVEDVTYNPTLQLLVDTPDVYPGLEGRRTRCRYDRQASTWRAPGGCVPHLQHFPFAHI